MFMGKDRVITGFFGGFKESGKGIDVKFIGIETMGIWIVYGDRGKGKFMGIEGHLSS